MSRLNVPSREQSPVLSKPLLDTVEKRLGVIPKLFRLIALSPAALEGFLSLNDAPGKTPDVKAPEHIALAVAQFNSCAYCLSAHTCAAVVFARRVVESRGRVFDAKLAAVNFVNNVARTDSDFPSVHAEVARLRAADVTIDHER